MTRDTDTNIKFGQESDRSASTVTVETPPSSSLTRSQQILAAPTQPRVAFAERRDLIASAAASLNNAAQSTHAANTISSSSSRYSMPITDATGSSKSILQRRGGNENNKHESNIHRQQQQQHVSLKQEQVTTSSLASSLASAHKAVNLLEDQLVNQIRIAMQRIREQVDAEGRELDEQLQDINSIDETMDANLRSLVAALRDKAALVGTRNVM